jgi:hypothetical protein
MGIRDTTYYGWVNFAAAESSPESKLTVVAANSVAHDSLNDILYVAGWQNRSGPIEGVVYRSLDKGETWSTVDTYTGGTPINQDIAIDSSGAVWVVGSNAGAWVVRKSPTGASGTFDYIENFIVGGTSSTPIAVAIDSADSVYVIGYETVSGESSNWTIRKSTTGLSGSFETIGSLDRDNSVDLARDIAIDSQDNIYVVGTETVSGESYNWVVLRSTTGESGSFSYVDSMNRDNNLDVPFAVEVDSQGAVYVAGYETVGGSRYWVVRKSATGASGTFDYVDSVEEATAQARAIAVDSQDSVYVLGSYPPSVGFLDHWALRRSPQGASGTFETVENFLNETENRPGEVFYPGYNAPTAAHQLVIDGEDFIYGVAQSTFGNRAVCRRGKRAVNSSSLGPRMLATSIGYVHTEISGVLTEKFKLNNLTEFPHAGGIFQMPNLVLGTTDSGQTGNTEDSIVQVNYFGSVVKVLWPKQKDQNQIVKGFGDVSAGQRAGKLSTQFEPGDFVDVSEFDHLSLYCYLLKNESGSLDNVDIKIERRPLRSTGFSTEQTVEYSASGSVTIAELKDLVYRKQIDYGDLDIKEIGYPIDVPLTNVREVRISAKHVTGQSSEENKNFIVWGRLINSEEET